MVLDTSCQHPVTRTHAVSEAPASSIARSMQAVGTACPTLVGRKANMLEANATRDVTSLLNKSGMAMKIPRHTLAPGFKNTSVSFGDLVDRPKPYQGCYRSRSAYIVGFSFSAFFPLGTHDRVWSNY